MSKYYKVEDVIDTLAEQWHFEATIDCPYAADDIEEWKQNARELYAELPTIEVSEDCISRKAIISRIESERSEWGEDYDVEQILGDIEDAPSVVPTGRKNRQVERAEGEWIEEVGDCEGKSVRYICSQCGDDDGWINYNYCPNCGSKMEIEE